MKLTKNDVGAIYRNNDGDYVRITGHNRDGTFNYSRYNTLEEALAGDEGNRTGHGSCLDKKGYWDGSKTFQFALKELVEPAKCVFKVGDRVKTLRFPRDVFPHFCSSMEPFVGKVGKVTEVGLNFVRVHNWNWVNSAVVLVEDEKPTCLKTRLRTREIGRKFKTRGGATATLAGPSYNPSWPWYAGIEDGCNYMVTADGRHQIGASSPYDLVERLPAEKKTKPAAPKSKFKVGDRVDFLAPGGTPYTDWTNVKVTKIVPDATWSVVAENADGLRGASDETHCRHTKLKTYPDYKKMKAGLEKIRDDSPIGSDAARWAKDALEPEPV